MFTSETAGADIAFIPQEDHVGNCVVPTSTNLTEQLKIIINVFKCSWFGKIEKLKPTHLNHG
jgi:hypothetical protein